MYHLLTRISKLYREGMCSELFSSYKINFKDLDDITGTATSD